VVHGIGVLKLVGMRRELGPIAVAMQCAIKHALDPLGTSTRGHVVG
jgi:glycolate oxidase